MFERPSSFGLLQDKKYMTIQVITNELQQLATRLESGALNAEEIMSMTELSRQLHERLIILQYKAFEVQVHVMENPAAEEHSEQDPPAIEVMPDPKPFLDPVSDLPKVEEPPLEILEMEEVEIPLQKEEEPEEEIPEERPVFRFSDTEVSPNQISLIDSIEEIKRMEQSINQKYTAGDGPSLAERLNQKPVSNLKSAIGLNQKFQFLSVLFKSDKEAYDMSIDRLNKASSYLEADEYIQNTLKNRYDWEMKSPVVKEFMYLIERRFL